jgi:beta-lactamase regulating signal transducer with metallopeptidase domain
MIELSVLLDAWAAALGRASWQGSLVVLAAWLVCWLIPSMPGRLQCWFWRLAILKFSVVLVCPSLLDLPLLPAPPAATSEYKALVTPDRSVVASGQASGRLSERDGPPRIVPLLFCTWMAGVGWALVRLLSAWRDAQHLRTEGQAITCSSTIDHVRAHKALFGLRASPELLQIAGKGSPMLIGFFRPALAIPTETLRCLTESERMMVLGHELAHIRRGDLIWSFVVALVHALFFFHPLVWWSQRRLHLAQELAADELAIARQQHDPIRYGKLLVSVVGKLGPSRLIPAASVGAAGTTEYLTRRLIAMTLVGRVSHRVVVSSGILLAALVLLGVVPWRLVAAESQANENATSAGVAPSPFAPPAHAISRLSLESQCEVCDNQLFAATIRISECVLDEPEKVIGAPRLLFAPGQSAFVQIGAEPRVFRVTIDSSGDMKDSEHMIEAKVIDDLLSTNPVVLARSKLRLAKAQTHGILAVKTDDCKYNVEATVQPAQTVEAYRVTDLLNPGKDGTPDFASLIKAIEAKVTPSAWAARGGWATMGADPSRGNLIVFHNPLGHELLGQLLSQLRQEAPGGAK